MIKIKINGKKYNLETCWEEISFRKFIGLIEVKTTKEILSVLLEIPLEELHNAKIDGLDIVLSNLAFLKKTPAVNETPTKLGDFVFPKDITFESIEQYEDTRAEINRVGALKDLGEHTRALALYAAIYITNPYDSDKAKENALKLYDLPCMEVLSAGSFFHAKYLSMESGYTMSYLRRNTLLKKKRPGLSRFMTRLGFMLHLTPSRVTLDSQTTK